MTSALSPAPVRRRITVKATPERAFDVFTRRIGLWWPKDKSIGGSPRANCVIEPGVGGRWYEVGEDSAEQEWGDVLVWEPPTRLVLAWRIGADFRFDPGLTTEVEVLFIEAGDGSTRVELEHRRLERWGERAEQARAMVDSPRGWTDVMAAYARTLGN